MRYLTMIIVIALCFGITGCGSSVKKKAADNEMKTKSEARIKLINQYEACISKAGGDASKIKECESILKAADKIK